MKEYILRRSEFKLRYFDFIGEKTPIPFIHGLGCAGSFDYVDVAFQEVLSDHRKIVIDLLGAGYSDKPKDFIYSVKAHAKYLNEFIEDIALKKVIVYGHSLGGAVAIELCNLCSTKIEKLILNEPNLEPSTKGTASWEFAQLHYENLESEMSRKVEEYQNSGNTMWVSTLKNWLPKAAYEISKDAVSGGKPSWKTGLFNFNFPRYFIFGEKSLPDKDYEELRCRDENIKVVKNVGHSMAWENPADVALVIRDCL